MKNNPYSQRIIDRIERQTVKGMKKYGANMQDNPLNLSVSEIVEYALEECADMMVYLEKVKEMIGTEDFTAKFPIRGLMQCLIEGSVSMEEVEARINGYFGAVRCKAKGEAKLEILNQALKRAQRSDNDAVSVSNVKRV